MERSPSPFETGCRRVSHRDGDSGVASGAALKLPFPVELTPGDFGPVQGWSTGADRTETEPNNRSWVLPEFNPGYKIILQGRVLTVATVHNLYAYILVNSGIVGFILFGLILISLFRLSAHSTIRTADNIDWDLFSAALTFLFLCWCFFFFPYWDTR